MLSALRADVEIRVRVALFVTQQGTFGSAPHRALAAGIRFLASVDLNVHPQTRSLGKLLFAERTGVLLLIVQQGMLLQKPVCDESLVAFIAAKRSLVAVSQMMLAQ